jgi:hypothetical protein
MATAPFTRGRLVDRWFYIGVAVATIITVVAGFGPSLVNTATRKAPLTPLAAAHGTVYLAWLLVLLMQTTLVATRRIPVHQRRIVPDGASVAIRTVASLFGGRGGSLDDGQ